MKFKYIQVEQIYKKDNVRNEQETELFDLGKSIDEFDLLQPILVRPVGERFEIISGHRRFQALKMHGDTEIPCIVRSDINDEDRIFIQLVENTHRKQMSAYEIVDTFNRIKKITGMTNADIAQKIGRTAQWVANQYVAVKLADKMYGDNPQAKKLSTGAIIGRAQRDGFLGSKKENNKIRIVVVGNKIQIYCKDHSLTGEISKMIEKLYIQKETEE